MYENQISSLSNSLNITLENDISIITLDDGINHTYCSKIAWEQDNYLPIGTARLIMPYSKDIEKYWTEYPGPVVIHANLNPKKNNVIASKIPSSTGISLNLRKVVGVDFEKDTNEKKIRFKNDNYNYAFIGKTYRFKQTGRTFIIYLEDLGWKFLQKVPKEFRDTYIANQSLDDAFQAICEFMGIEFAYSIEDLSEYNFSADGYSIEKDGKVIEDVPSILKEWANGSEEEEEEEEDMTKEEGMAKALQYKEFESDGLAEYNKTKKKANNNKKDNNSLNAKVTNKDEDEDKEGAEEDKNNESADKKIEEFQEEFDEKIKDLFIGNTFYDSDISNPVMNYDWITITPKAPASTDTTATTGSTATGASTGDNNSNTSNSTKNGWIGGQYYINGKIYLYTSYINSLSPSQAEAKYIQGQNTYTQDTLDRLRSRAAGNRVIA